jgi:hypothetical protein
MSWRGLTTRSPDDGRRQVPNDRAAMVRGDMCLAGRHTRSIRFLPGAVKGVEDAVGTGVHAD